MEYRYSIFSENMRYIEEHNSSNASYSLGVNQFADLTWEEFKNSYLSEPIENTEFTDGEVEDV